MKRGNLFWGVILIMLGVLFLLQTLGIINDVLGWFWPSVLILLGVWVLAGRFLPNMTASGETFSIDLQGATRVDLEVDLGAGSLILAGGAPTGVALVGAKGTTLDVNSGLSTSSSLGIKISAGPSFLPFLGPDGGEWHFSLSPEVPLGIKVDAGASNLDFDLTDLKVTYLGVDTGASSLKVKLPAQSGQTLLDVESGAARIEIFVPEGVGARIRLEQGASSVDIDEKRFPPLAGLGNLYQSADFDTAVNKAEINLEGGANSVKVR